jgi:hypothetical protein
MTTQVNHCTWKPCMEMKCHHQWRASEHQMKFQYPQKSGCCSQNLQGSIAAFLHSQPIDTRHPECPTWSQAQAAETKYTIKQFLQTDNLLLEITIPQRRVTTERPARHFAYHDITLSEHELLTPHESYHG